MKDLQKTTERERMVASQIASRGIRSEHLLEAMRTVPRERFVAPEMVEFAYEDSALPIEADQTISQPYIVALMIEAAEVRPGDRVLEVGAGSGYAAAVLSRITEPVYAVERHPALVESARRVLDDLGYDNVELLLGDGTLGWEEHAPFDAILVAAGGEKVPPALKKQLAPGGRLVMPVGDPGSFQYLKRFRKRDDGTLEEHDLGAVRFVPLIGTVAEELPRAAAEAAPEPRRGAPSRSAVDRIRRHARSFQGMDHAEVDAAAERMAGHRLVLLGEGSHGTSEFYELREKLTRRLVEAGEVDFVAVEADWPDALQLDRYVRGLDPLPETGSFTRFPRWMWANEETLAFLRWLRDFNADIDDPDQRVGFFGLDLYSLNTSMEAVLAYLGDVDEDAAATARDRYGCLTPWAGDPQTYGRMVTDGRLEACEDEVVDILADLLRERVRYEASDGMRYMRALENARVVANAERYYRAMYYSPSASWNLRDQHMFDTLENLLAFHGPDAGAAVWAHNSHLGDASATVMGARGKHNLGQLCRDAFPGGSYLVGMGTHRGTVMAAHAWGEAGRVMDVRPSLEGSYERLSHDVESPAFFLPMEDDELRRTLAPERLERAIGVIYRPETERVSHYFHASLPRQFDEWIFLDRTEAVAPLRPETGEVEAGVEDTYPFGV